MSVISRVGSIVTTASVAAGTTATVDLPADIPANSRVIVALAVNTDVSITTPSGWVNIFNTLDGAMRLAVYYNHSQTPASGGTLAFTIGSSSWAAIAACYEGAHFHGFSTLGFVSDVQGFTSTAETSTDTSTATATALSQQYRNQGTGCRLGFAAVRHATTGFASITASTGTMAKAAEVVSSGATPVTLAMGEDTSLPPPTGTWTVTATSTASSAERVAAAVALRPAVGPFYYTATTTVNSSSAGTSGTVTVPGHVAARNTLNILHFACNAGASFTVPSPWVEVHNTLTGNLRVQTYVHRPTPSIDTTVDFTLSGSADWTVTGVAFEDCAMSEDEASGGALFSVWNVDVDTANDAVITASTSQTAVNDYDFIYFFNAATGASQAVSTLSTTWAGQGSSTAIATAGASSGASRVATQTRMWPGPALAGTSGATSFTWAVSTTEKLIFTALIRCDSRTRKINNSIIQPSITQASRW